jgi:nicotinate-nucleotide--dimethylbenzimidazole phosphoribosyltransferase
VTTTLDLESFAASVPRPDDKAGEAARLRLARAAGALGRLEDLSVWLSAAQGVCPPRPIERARVVVFAGDHGVARTGVSASPPAATAEMVRDIASGGGAVNVLARLADASVRVVDLAVDADLSDLPAEVTEHKVRRGSGNIALEPALTRAEAEQAFLAGVAVADAEVDSGADLLIAGDVGVGSTTAAAALVAVLTGAEVATVVGRGSGIDDRAWMVKCAAVRDASRRGRRVTADMAELLAEVGGADLAAISGFLVEAAVRRTPALLDGVVCGAAALVADRIGYRCRLWWLAGHVSTEPAHRMALARLQLEPLLDYRLGIGGGAGALLALPLLRAAGALVDRDARGSEQELG